MDANAIHAKLGPEGWRNVLLLAGIDAKFLRNKHGPCPGCGGSDRFRFDNKHGRGDFYCNQCGAGDGFKLVMNSLRISFADARKQVMGLAGMEESSAPRPFIHAPEKPEIARPTRRVHQLLRESCIVEDCAAACIYLASRELWPLPKGHSLKAHPSVQYWEEGRCVGRFPALVAAVRDGDGDLVTAHVTYLTEDGAKIEHHTARKLLSALTGREGCAVPLMRLDGSTLGIAEGIETALSAAKIASMPVWAALNTALLAKFEPPAEIGKLVIFADRDIAGLDAASKLMERLQEKVRLEIRTPQAKDWNDHLRGSP